MFAYYSFRGLILQVFAVNLLFGMSSIEAQKLDKIKISVNFANVSLQEALQTIGNESNLIFSYNSKEIPIDAKVSLNLRETTVDKVLTKLAQDLDLSFSQIGNFIVVKKKDKPDGNYKGEIRGQITSAEDKKVLPFATVMVVGTNLGAATDLDGNYIIRNVDVGKRTISVSYVGYETKKIDVEIKPDKVTELNISLKITAVKGKEVVITAQRVGQQGAINEQINSNTIKNVVSSDRLRENPDANAAESIGRLPGISLIRSGGEGTGIVIRGLDPKYSTVMLDGVQLPSTDLNNRSTNISGLSQYLLQSIEVYKSITPDMDGNSVAGSVNLTLAPAPKGLNFNVIAQSGYNHQNNYWGNYTFEADASNRFLNNKFGVRLSLDAERVNRGRQTLGASYGVNSNTTGGLGYEQVLLYSASLNNILDIKEKQAATLVLDWQFSPDSKLFFYNFFSANADEYSSFNKSFSPGGGVVTYNADLNNNGKNLLYTGLLKGETAFNLFDLDYGVSFSQSHNYVPLDMTWSFFLPNAYDAQYKTNEEMTLPPDQIIKASNDNSNVQTLRQIKMSNMGYNQNDLLQKDLNIFLNIKVPFKLGNDISGYLKGGVKYKNTDRNVNSFSANQSIASNNQFYGYANQALNWVQPADNVPSALSFANGNTINNFISGKYDFGWNINFNRLSEIWQWWNDFSNRVIKGDSVSKTVGQFPKIGFVPDFYGSSINNQDITEKYYGTYLMTVLNFGDLISFIPGVRYEKVTDNMIGNYVYNMAVSYTLNFPRNIIKATSENEFYLPNVHLIIKPLDWMHIQAAYTKTLGRPDYNQIMPNTFINNGIAPYIYQAGNPNLKPEQWSGYDLQVAVFGNEIGLFSVDGFYKEVKDQIWTRTYNRIPGDPIIPGFGSNDQVITTVTLNHNQIGYVKGLEFEWQTSFWYLPEPFNYFSLNVNYTLMNSRTQYPTQRLFTTYETDSRGRPIPTLNRVDSTVVDKMLNQPNSISNISLGFNYKGLNLWLSYQYNGPILTSWSNQRELIGTQSSYQRWDLQIAQNLPIKGLILRLDVANINNEQQTSNLISDPRPTYIESYGWTSDFGIMYNF